ncbi:hypothetical protein V8E53_003778 [Lactarius tabidus]
MTYASDPQCAVEASLSRTVQSRIIPWDALCSNMKTSLSRRIGHPGKIGRAPLLNLTHNGERLKNQSPPERVSSVSSVASLSRSHRTVLYHFGASLIGASLGLSDDLDLPLARLRFPHHHHLCLSSISFGDRSQNTLPPSDASPPSKLRLILADFGPPAFFKYSRFFSKELGPDAASGGVQHLHLMGFDLQRSAFPPLQHPASSFRGRSNFLQLLVQSLSARTTLLQYFPGKDNIGSVSGQHGAVRCGACDHGPYTILGSLSRPCLLVACWWYRTRAIGEKGRPGVGRYLSAAKRESAVLRKSLSRTGRGLFGGTLGRGFQGLRCHTILHGLSILHSQLEGGQIGGSARILSCLSVISTKPSFVQRGELRQAAGYLTRDRVTGH